MAEMLAFVRQNFPLAKALLRDKILAFGGDGGVGVMSRKSSVTSSKLSELSPRQIGEGEMSSLAIWALTSALALTALAEAPQTKQN
jgi:hypothetical protein